MQESKIQEIIIPKEGIRIVLLAENGERKSSVVLSQTTIQMIIREAFRPVKHKPTGETQPNEGTTVTKG